MSAVLPTQPKSLPLPDAPLFWSALVLSLLGWVMVGSSSMEFANSDRGNPYHFAVLHGMFWLVSAGAALFFAGVDLKFLQRNSHWAYLLGLALLVLVFVPGVGKTVNGSTRWLDLRVFSLQSSEIAKVCMAIYLASFLVRFGAEATQTFWGFARPMLVTGVYGFLLLLEPDLGAFVILFGMVLCVLFLAGTRLSHWLVVLSIVGVLITIFATTEAYRMRRIQVLLNPWDFRFDEAYQLTQALLAFGQGGWFGTGLGNSVQKLFYLPEAHTDFLFAILAEELGLVGAFTVIGLFGVVVFRSFRIARQAELIGLYFHAYLGYAFALFFAAQAVVNMGVNTGLLPTTGLTLPFMSYGGSSLLVSGVMLGILQRIAYDTQEGRRA